MKRAIISLRPELIVKFLSLPEGVTVRTVSGDWMTDSVHIMLEGEGLPTVAEHVPGAYPMQLGLNLKVEEDGRIKVEW